MNISLTCQTPDLQMQLLSAAYPGLHCLLQNVVELQNLLERYLTYLMPTAAG